MNIYVKLKNVGIDDKFINAFNQRLNIKKNKIVYDFNFDSVNGVFTIAEVTDYKTLLYTIRWIDDVFDHFYRDDLDSEFAWAVSTEILDLDKDNVEEGITRFYRINKELIKSIEHLSMFKIIEDNYAYVDIKFDYYSKLEYTNIVKLDTIRGVANFQVARTEDKRWLYSIFWLGEYQEIKNVRIHYQCETSEVFGSKHCDCREQKDNFMDKMFARGEGMFIYAHEEGRGMGLFNKNNAYFLTQEEGLDTKKAMEKIVGTSEMRNFEIPGDILQQKGIKKINLWTNNPRKILPIQFRGIEVIRKEAWYECDGEIAKKYMKDKRDYLNHMED